MKKFWYPLRCYETVHGPSRTQDIQHVGRGFFFFCGLFLFLAGRPFRGFESIDVFSFIGDVVVCSCGIELVAIGLEEGVDAAREEFEGMMGEMAEEEEAVMGMVDAMVRAYVELGGAIDAVNMMERYKGRCPFSVDVYNMLIALSSKLGDVVTTERILSMMKTDEVCKEEDTCQNPNDGIVSTEREGKGLTGMVFS